MADINRDCSESAARIANGREARLPEQKEEMLLVFGTLEVKEETKENKTKSWQLVPLPKNAAALGWEARNAWLSPWLFCLSGKCSLTHSAPRRACRAAADGKNGMQS
jgi:hypothetical protein